MMPHIHENAKKCCIVIREVKVNSSKFAVSCQDVDELASLMNLNWQITCLYIAVFVSAHQTNCTKD
jgi:hypothetical protein